jgi:hypothetical protein
MYSTISKFGGYIKIHAKIKRPVIMYFIYIYDGLKLGYIVWIRKLTVK